MYIIEVIPIAGLGKETLSYFASAPAEPGTLVSIPLRNRRVRGFVVRATHARESRSTLRSMPFALKKAQITQTQQFLPRAFIETATATADYYATSTGAILDAFIPRAILDTAEKERFGTHTHAKARAHAKKIINPFETSLLHASIDDRIDHYKRLVRESFARNTSIMILTPTTEAALLLVAQLSRGIEQYSVCLSSAQGKAIMQKAWRSIATAKHPVLVIGTGGSVLVAPREDFSHLIIEDEGASGFVQPRRPFADARTFAECYARRAGIHLVFAGTIVRIDTILRRSDHHSYIEPRSTIRDASAAPILEDLTPPQFHIPAPAGQTRTLIDMREYKATADKTSIILSDDLQQSLVQTEKKGERAMLFVARRGAHPTTVCGDCDTVVTCTRCSAPVVLHKTSLGPRFFCHKCGRERRPEDRCATCGGWQFATLGIGIELVEETLAESFPNLNVFRIDADVTPTKAKARATVAAFLETPSAVLLGTEMALPLLSGALHAPPTKNNSPTLMSVKNPFLEANGKKSCIDHAAVISLDSLFALPDFRINERIMAIITTLRTITDKTLIVQSRSVHRQTLSHALAGDTTAFYQNEVAERKALDYPPFSTFIKITLAGKEASVRQEMSDLKHFLGNYPVRVFPAFTHLVRNQFIMHALLKLPKGMWSIRRATLPGEVTTSALHDDDTKSASDLLEKLRSLPPQFTIQVDPESVL